ncbi:YhgE/Pip family protein [Bacillus sp. 1P06AnD]|uniref:YhgE/Pip family protein n=1 Tax=Bacillus sp. 1P06AnD TaxID=3132208 RepID=UPI0039A12D79
MKGRSFLGEWKSIFSNKSLLIPILAVMLIPVLYAGMFLWAFWDPYAKLSDLPVVVVNEDKGASFEDEKLSLGDELVDNLKDNKQFKFVTKDKKQGYQDLEDQKYYMLVEIPEDFSENATTILDQNPKKLELKYVPNEGYNFLSAQIGDTAIEKIKGAVSEQIIKTYSETVFDKVKTMADGYQNASKNANTLYDGVLKVNDGSKTIKEKLELLASKQIEFKSGVDQVYDGLVAANKGSQTLNNGLVQLSRAHGQLENHSVEVKNGIDELASKSGELISGVNKAADGSQKLNAGLQQASSKSSDLAAGANQVQAGLNELSKNTPGLAQGADKLAAGAGKLSNGASQVSDGATKLSSGASSLNQGIKALQQSLQPMMASLPDGAKQQVANALAQLVEGSQQIATQSGALAQGASSLNSGAKELNSGAAELKNGANQVNSGASKLSDGAGQVSTGASALSAGLGDLSKGSSDLNNGLGQLVEGSGQLAGGIGRLQAGQNKVVAGMQQYGDKFKDAVDGSANLNSGISKLTGGATKLSDGSGQLAEGANQLSAGAKELQDGTGKVEDGTKEFKDELGKAADESSKVSANDKTYDMMSQPVKVDKDPVDHVPNYGTGFAPYFLSLGLFVGALMLSIVFPLFEPAVQPRNGFTWFLSKFGVLAVVGILQALIADAILIFALGIDVQSVPLFLLFSIVTSLVFMTLIQFFVTTLGNPGRFTAILLLIFQLTTSAGTFPLELIPKFLQFFNRFLPMTYTVRGFKAAITSGNNSYLLLNTGILAIFIVVFMIGTALFFVFKHKRRYNGINNEQTVEA